MSGISVTDLNKNSPEISSHPEMAVPQTSTSADSVARDPASSLRAAALLTLKSKRRKPNPSTVLQASLPARSDSQLQLDYGQGDSSPAPGKSSRTSSAGPPTTTTDVEDGQIREEGEISDTEGPTELKLEVSTSKHDLNVVAPSVKQSQDTSMSKGKGKSPILRNVEDPPITPMPGTPASNVRGALRELDSNLVRPGLARVYISITLVSLLTFVSSDSGTV